jgi:hypothetical protein
MVTAQGSDRYAAFRAPNATNADPNLNFMKPTAGIDDASFLEGLFPGVRFAYANALNMPFEDRAFDLVHSSAVLEHVGSLENQIKMVAECLRVANRGVCLTTPNRWFPIEVHSQLPFIHWLPKRMYRAFFRGLGYGFFADEANLNLLSHNELRYITINFAGWRFQVVSAKLLGWTSNLMLSPTERTIKTLRGRPKQYLRTYQLCCIW